MGSPSPCCSLLLENPYCIVVRPYLVWASSFVLLFSVFITFVSIGWPGNPASCVYEVPPYHGCSCESFSIEDVETGEPGVRQPVNTWCNVVLTVVTSGFVAWRMSQDRKRLFFFSNGPTTTTDNPKKEHRNLDHTTHEQQQQRTTKQQNDKDESSFSVMDDTTSMTELDVTVVSEATAVRIADDEESASLLPRKNNVMLSDNVIADWYVFMTICYGFGKMLFHGSLTTWSIHVDGVTSTMVYAFLPWYMIRRINPSNLVFWLGYFGSIGMATGADLLLGSWTRMISVTMMLLLYLLMEVYMGATTGVFFMGTCQSVSIWILGLLMSLVATFFWWTTSRTMGLCDPDSLWQIHGVLVWHHPLANSIMILLYLYWRLGDDDADDEDLKDDDTIIIPRQEQQQRPVRNTRARDMLAVSWRGTTM
jgi:hypothetical protein